MRCNALRLFQSAPCSSARNYLRGTRYEKRLLRETHYANALHRTRYEGRTPQTHSRKIGATSTHNLRWTRYVGHCYEGRTTQERATKDRTTRDALRNGWLTWLLGNTLRTRRATRDERAHAVLSRLPRAEAERSVPLFSEYGCCQMRR